VLLERIRAERASLHGSIAKTDRKLRSRTAEANTWLSRSEREHRARWTRFQGRL